MTSLAGTHKPLDMRHRWSDAGRGFVALIGVVVLVVGVPVALISWVAWPLPTEVPSVSKIGAALRDTYIPDEFLVKALAVVCWLVWIELVASLLVEAVAYVRGRRAGAVPLAGGLQRAAARLVATVALLGSLLATKGLPGDGDGSRALAPPAHQPVVTLVTDQPAGEPAARSDERSPARAATPAPTYEVQRRDTLWDIAERHLGDPFRWRDIFRLNEGRVQPDGRCLTDPDLIHAGWRLELPEDARGLVRPAPSPSPSAPAASPAPRGPGADGGGMVLLDDGRDDRAVMVADEGAAPSDPGGMVLLPDDEGRDVPPVPPPVPTSPGEHIAAGDE